MKLRLFILVLVFSTAHLCAGGLLSKPKPEPVITVPSAQEIQQATEIPSNMLTSSLYLAGEQLPESQIIAAVNALPSRMWQQERARGPWWIMFLKPFIMALFTEQCVAHRAKLLALLTRNQLPQLEGPQNV